MIPFVRDLREEFRCHCPLQFRVDSGCRDERLPTETKCPLATNHKQAFLTKIALEDGGETREEMTAMLERQVKNSTQSDSHGGRVEI